MKHDSPPVDVTFVIDLTDAELVAVGAFYDAVSELRAQSGATLVVAPPALVAAWRCTSLAPTWRAALLAVALLALVYGLVFAVLARRMERSRRAFATALGRRARCVEASAD